MSSFKDLLARVSILNEAKMSPYAGAHPSFGNITSKMRAGGLSSAPLDTIKFIREILYMLDIIDDQELVMIKKAPGFTGKKQAMLNVLKTKQQEINAKSDEISERVSSTLDDFISGVGVNRGKEEKYAAQAASQEIANQMRQVKSGKQMDDALTDIISDETILVKTAVANILAKIGNNIGEPGFDIDEEALGEVMSYSNKITNLATLKSFIRQISGEPGYEKIAAYLSSAVKAISQGSEDEEMEDSETEDEEMGPEEFYDPSGRGVDPEEYDEVMSTAAQGDEYEGEVETVWIGDDGEEVEGVLTYTARRDPATGEISIDLTGGHATGYNTAAKVDKYYIDYIISSPQYNSDYKADALEDAKLYFNGREEEEESKPDYLDFDKDGDKDEPMKSALRDKDEEEESRVEQVKDYTVHFGTNGKVKKVDHSDRSAHVDPALVNKYLKEGFPLSRACAAATSYPNDPNPLHDEAGMLGESYTSTYIVEQKRKDSYSKKPQEVGQSFKERYKPKTSYQLDELRRYGL